MDYAEKSLELHYKLRGKLETVSKVHITDKESLSLAYTPGVACPCEEIKKDIDKSYTLTGRGNTIAVVTDGTAVLGLGDIGPEAGMPVMEGKCALFKEFGGVDAVPLCIRSKEPDDIVRTVSLLAGSFGGINLEDISAPRCFEIERRLKESCDIPIFHDDQHGTAVVVLAALTNALKITNRKIEEIHAVISGAGAAGTAIAKLLYARGLKHIIMVDKDGILAPDRKGLDSDRLAFVKLINPECKHGTLAEAMCSAELFIGVSAANIVTEEMVRSMAAQPILFPMANPVPEIMPEQAIKAGAAIVGTGRSDYPNQINNVLAFPGIFRGVLDVRASDINDEMKLAAADALASLVSPSELSKDKILPEAFDKRVGTAVAAAVAQAAAETGVARINKTQEE